VDAYSNALDRTARPEAVVSTDQTDIVLTIEEAARWLRVGRTTMYALVMSGEIRSVTIGRLRRVPTHCLTEYVNSLLGQAHSMSPAA
jgi:excisionase family DNA binding protein